MKKCPRCDSVSADADSSCGVCGGSLSDVASERLESLVQKEPRVEPKKQLNLVVLALLMIALIMTGIGAFLLVLFNLLGLFFFPAGLVIVLYISGGPGIGLGGSRYGAKDSMRRAKDEQVEQELKRTRGEED